MLIATGSASQSVANTAKGILSIPPATTPHGFFTFLIRQKCLESAYDVFLENDSLSLPFGNQPDNILLLPVSPAGREKKAEPTI
jgi:hypothetical protein